MKTRFFGAMALAMAIFAMTACQKDKIDDTWKQLPVEQITVESGNAKISVNEVPCTYGNVQLVAGGEDNAVLTLTGAVPGFSEVKVNVDLLKRGENTYHFSGSEILTTPPSIAATLRSVESSGFYTVAVAGDATVEGTISVGVTTYVSSAMTASLKGSWNLVRKCRYIENVGPDPEDCTPVRITWKKMADGVGETLAPMISLANIIGSSILAEVFDQVTFDETGNIMARYWPELGTDDDDPSGILSFVTGPEDGYYNFTPKKHTEWLDSPKANLAFWYATGNSIYIVPNVAAIMNAADSESGTRTDESGIDLSSIMELLSKLKEYGVDVNALNTELQKMLSRGIELKYSQDGDNLKIYVDKALCAPIVEALLPALPTLDTLLDQLVQAGNETAQTIKSVLPNLGLEKPSDLANLWEATTEFEIALNFIKA